MRREAPEEPSPALSPSFLGLPIFSWSRRMGYLVTLAIRIQSWIATSGRVRCPDVESRPTDQFCAVAIRVWYLSYGIR
jgi:hypothetical protein